MCQKQTALAYHTCLQIMKHNKCDPLYMYNMEQSQNRKILLTFPNYIASCYYSTKQRHIVQDYMLDDYYTVTRLFWNKEDLEEDCNQCYQQQH